MDPEIRLGQLVAVRGRFIGHNEDGSLRVEIPVADGPTLRLEPGDILCGLDMAGQVPAVTGQLPVHGAEGILLRVRRVTGVASDGSCMVILPGGVTARVHRSDLVTAASEELAPLEGDPSLQRTRQIMAAQDDCMYAMSHNLPLPTTALQNLPPWRALFWAEAAESAQAARGDDAENCLQDGHIDALRMECQNAADEMRYPGKWW